MTNNNQIIRVSGETGVSIHTESPTNQLGMIRTALESKMVNNTSDFDLFEIIKKSYLLMHLEIKYKLPDDQKDIDYCCAAVVKGLRRNPKNIRTDEIEIALINGVNGEYGEFMGISAVTIGKFISEYCKGEIRAEALRLRNQPPPTKPKPTAEEIFNFGKNNTLQAFTSFLENSKRAFVNRPTDEKLQGLHGHVNTMGRFASPAFDFLYQQKMLLISQQQIDDYFKKANELYFIELKIKRQLNQDPVKRKQINNEIAGFVEMVGLEEKSVSEIQSVKTAGIVKALATEFYFSFECEAESVEELAELIEKSRTIKI